MKEKEIKGKERERERDRNEYQNLLTKVMIKYDKLMYQLNISKDKSYG